MILSIRTLLRVHVNLMLSQKICLGFDSNVSGTKGMRNSLPNARIMIHQPSGGVTGQATDIMIQAEEIIKLKKQINGIYEKHTGMPLDKIESSMERDNFMSPKEALEFGLIDNVLSSPSKPKAGKENISRTNENSDIIGNRGSSTISPEMILHRSE